MVKSASQIQHYLPTRFYVELPAIARDLGLDLTYLLKDTGLAEKQLKQAEVGPSVPITQTSSEQLILNLLSLTKNPGLGFILGARYNFSSHGVIGFAALTSENVGAALSIAARYFPVLTHLFSVTPPYPLNKNSKARKEDEKLSFNVIEINANTDMLPEVEEFMLDAILANLHVMAQFLLGDKMPPYSIELKSPLQPYHRDYANQKDITILGSHKQIRILIPSNILSQPLPLADELTLQKNLKECDALLVSIKKTPLSLSQVIANKLEKDDCLFLSQEDIASKLNLSRRALHRLLQKEGKNFRGIANQARITQAKHLLTQPGYSISQVGHELGYTDAANFTRAFKKLEGMSPRDYRAKHLN